jgi:hypothetical protein
MEEIRTKLLVTITNKGKDKRIKNLYKRHNIKYSTEINGLGTASSSVLNYFGLEEIQKKIILSIIPYNLEGKILEDLHKKLKIYEPGNGIAFTLSITSASRYLSRIYAGEIGDDTIMKKEKEYELIVLIVSEGYAELAMDAAKRRGAGGGTLISGVGLGSAEATKILGITIEPEKDVVLILTDKNNKKDVMEEVSQSVGLATEGRGICFSLSVDNVVGLTENVNFEKNKEKEFDKID